MRSDSPDEITRQDLVAEMRAIVDHTRKTIEASQAILDLCTERCPAEGTPECGEPGPSCEPQDFLGEISEGLIHAHRFAKHDGDALTVTLIEKALFHIGRRLARGLSIADAGLVCH